jgi:hypothetical protein
MRFDRGQGVGRLKTEGPGGERMGSPVFGGIVTGER